MHQRHVGNYNYIEPSQIYSGNMKCCCLSAPHLQITFSVLLFNPESLCGCRAHTEPRRIFTVALSVSLTTTHIIAALCHAMCVTGSPRIGPGLHLITLLLPVLHIWALMRDRWEDLVTRAENNRWLTKTKKKVKKRHQNQKVLVDSRLKQIKKKNS